MNIVMDASIVNTMLWKTLNTVTWTRRQSHIQTSQKTCTVKAEERIEMWNMQAVRQAEALKYGKNKSNTLARLIR